MAKIKIDGWQCDRCGHQWPPRHIGDPQPTVCPKCKSKLWATPYKYDGAAANAEARRAAAEASAEPKSPTKPPKKTAARGKRKS